MGQFQNSISERLHHHTFFNIFFDEISKAYRAQILSCSSTRVSVELTIRSVFPTFQLYPPDVSIAFCMQFGLPHPSIANIL
jgi:hypothetical protein